MLAIGGAGRPGPSPPSGLRGVTALYFFAGAGRAAHRRLVRVLLALPAARPGAGPGRRRARPAARCSGRPIAHRRSPTGRQTGRSPSCRPLTLPPVVVADRRLQRGRRHRLRCWTRFRTTGRPAWRPRPIVVVDGGTDDTAAIARAHGALRRRACPQPRPGRGAAARLLPGPARRRRLHRDHRRRRPVRHRRSARGCSRRCATAAADFVTGSRRLGAQRVGRSGAPRRHGVLRRPGLAADRHRVTDTVFGFRAMRADVTARRARWTSRSTSRPSC